MELLKRNINALVKRSSKFRKTASPSLTITVNSNKGWKRDRVTESKHWFKQSKAVYQSSLPSVPFFHTLLCFPLNVLLS